MDGKRRSQCPTHRASFEIKNPEYDGKLTADEQEWHDMWRGQVAVVETIEDILEVVR